MLCDVMLCDTMLYYVMLRIVVLCYVILCCVVLRYVMLSVAGADLELKRGPVLIYLPCWLFPLLSFLLFYPK